MAAPIRFTVLSRNVKLIQTYTQRSLSVCANIGQKQSCSFVSHVSRQQELTSLFQPSTFQVSSYASTRFCSSATSSEKDADDSEMQDEEYHSIIKDSEHGKGPSEAHEFQAETRKLLDIVAKSLYSEKEVFIRELISNASDALERLRYVQASNDQVVDSDGKLATSGAPLEIHIAVDEDKKTFTIQDTGIGLSRNELIENLGTIARSGSKAFLNEVGDKAPSGSAASNIIGQFGVGFYSSFMVGEKVDVYSRPNTPGSKAHKWTSDGLGTYDITEAEGVERGTKIIIHLKGDCYEYAKEEKIAEIVKKYSNFVGVPIYLNGKKINIIQALWLMDQKDITQDMHNEFYSFIGGAFDNPRYQLHYKADAPINIRALFYVPEYKPSMFDMSRETDVSVTLYCRKIMIMAKANNVLPRWLRFMRGVVDSEDIPLNLSRELLQDSNLIRKLRWVLTNRLLKFFQERARKDPKKFLEFYKDYGLFLREGIVTTHDQSEREEIAKLLRFESSKMEPGEVTSLDEYAQRMKAGGREIYYFSAPSRQLAESSPYVEAFAAKDQEVLYCYEPYDELVLMNLAQFDKKKLKSIENELSDDNDSDVKDTATEEGKESLTKEQCDDLLSWLQVVLGNKIKKTKVTHRLSSHPCIVSIVEMGSARHLLRTAMSDKSVEERNQLLQSTLEINPTHSIIRKLYTLKSTDDKLARLVADQLYDNAMLAAGLIEDPRSMLGRLNELMSKALEKH